MTWEDWIAYHATLFAWNDDAGLRTLAAWADLFAHAGHSPSEMAEASRGLAAGDVPRFRQDYLPALRRLAGASRQAKAARGPAEAPRPSCELCGGNGVVPLPHPQRRRKWQDVRCRCSPGGGAAPLGEYRAQCPDWAERLDEWLEERCRRCPALANTWRKLAARARRFGEG